MGALHSSMRRWDPVATTNVREWKRMPWMQRCMSLSYYYSICLWDLFWFEHLRTWKVCSVLIGFITKILLKLIAEALWPTLWCASYLNYLYLKFKLRSHNSSPDKLHTFSCGFISSFTFSSFFSFLTEINTFIQQGCIKLFKKQDFYIVTKIFQINAIF